MRHSIWKALALASALALAGCGGGGSSDPPASTVGSVNDASKAPRSAPGGGFKAMVVFGDSLSDDGAYTLAAISQYGAQVPFTGLPYAAGGQFTVNGAATGNWTNVVAKSLGLGLTPNLIGYAGNYLNPPSATPSTTPVYCPFGRASNCYDFAQGGAMVSNPDGIGHAGGALTIPVTRQVQNYLTQFGRFNHGQLITVHAGNNDVFTAFGNLGAQVTQAVTQATTQAAQAGHPLTPAQLAALQQQVTSLALVVAQAQVSVAADELAGVVQAILATGGKYVLVYTLADSSLTPFGRGLPYTGATPPTTPPAGYDCNNKDTTQPCYLLSNLVQVFNKRLLNALQGQPVKILGAFGLLTQEVANPAQFGFTNVTTPWCNPATTSSLLCNVNTPNTAAGASSANLGTWLFADSVHPTPAGYQVVANATLQAISSYGWVQLPPSMQP